MEVWGCSPRSKGQDSIHAHKHCWNTSVYLCFIRALSRSRTHTDAAVLGESHDFLQNLMTVLSAGEKELKSRPYDWSCDSWAHYTRRASPHHSSLCFTLPLLRSPPLPLSPISYVLSLLPLLSCDPLSLLHRINRLGIPLRVATGVQRTQQEWYLPVLALSQPTPLKPEHTYSFWSASVNRVPVLLIWAF